MIQKNPISFHTKVSMVKLMEVSMVKLMLQIAAEMLNCVARPQRDNDHSDKCFYPVAQHKLKVSLVKPVLQNTAEANV